MTSMRGKLLLIGRSLGPVMKPLQSLIEIRQDLLQDFFAVRQITHPQIPEVIFHLLPAFVMNLLDSLKARLAGRLFEFKQYQFNQVGAFQGGRAVGRAIVLLDVPFPSVLFTLKDFNFGSREAFSG